MNHEFFSSSCSATDFSKISSWGESAFSCLSFCVPQVSLILLALTNMYFFSVLLRGWYLQVVWWIHSVQTVLDYFLSWIIHSALVTQECLVLGRVFCVPVYCSLFTNFVIANHSFIFLFSRCISSSGRLFLLIWYMLWSLAWAWVFFSAWSLLVPWWVYLLLNKILLT